MQLHDSESPIDLYAEKPSNGTQTLSNVRCDTCGKLLAELVTTPFRIHCMACKNYTQK